VNPMDNPAQSEGLLASQPIAPLPEWLLAGPHAITADIRRLESADGRWVEFPLAVFAGAPNAVAFIPVYRDAQLLREDFPGGEPIFKIQSGAIGDGKIERLAFVPSNAGQYGPEGPPKTG
jgi:hypothetical protein